MQAGPSISTNPMAMSIPGSNATSNSGKSSSPAKATGTGAEITIYRSEDEAIKAMEDNNSPTSNQTKQPEVKNNGWRISCVNSNKVLICIKDGSGKGDDLYVHWPLEELAKQISILSYQKSNNPNAKINFSISDVAKMLEEYEQKPVNALSKMGNSLKSFGQKLTRRKPPTTEERNYLKEVLNDIVITTQAHQLGEVANQIFAAKDKDGEIADSFSVTVSGSTIHKLTTGEEQNKRIKNIFNTNTLARNLNKADNKEEHEAMLKTAYQINDLMNSVTFKFAEPRPTGLSAYISWPTFVWKAKTKEWEYTKNVRDLADIRKDREEAIQKAKDELLELNAKQDADITDADKVRKKHLKEKLERLKTAQIRDQESLGIGIAEQKPFQTWKKSNLDQTINSLVQDENPLEIKEIMDQAEAYETQQSQVEKKTKTVESEETEEKDEPESFEELSHYQGNRAITMKKELEYLRANTKDSLDIIKKEKSEIEKELSKIKRRNQDKNISDLFDIDSFNQSFNKDFDNLKARLKKLRTERKKIGSKQDAEEKIKECDDEIADLEQNIEDMKIVRTLYFTYKNLEKLEQWIIDAKLNQADETNDQEEKGNFEEDENLSNLSNPLGSSIRPTPALADVSDEFYFEAADASSSAPAIPSTFSTAPSTASTSVSSASAASPTPTAYAVPPPGNPAVPSFLSFPPLPSSPNNLGSASINLPNNNSAPSSVQDSEPFDELAERLKNLKKD